MKKGLWMLLACGCLAFVSCDKETDVNVDNTPTPTESVTDGTNTDDKNSTNGDDKNSTSTDSTQTDIPEGAYWAPRGQVALGNYKGVEVPKVKVEVTEEEVQNEIDYLLYYASELAIVEDRNIIEDGDIVNISYSLTVNGEEIDSNEEYDLEIGSGEIIEIEELLIGRQSETSHELETELIDDINYSDYLGQKGVWNITINTIQQRVTPELTDSFVSDNTEYTTVEEYRQSVYDEIVQAKSSEAEQEQIRLCFDRIMDGCAFAGVDDRDIQSYIDEVEKYYANYASMYGMELEDFVAIFTGTSYEEFQENLKKEANFIVRQNLIIATIIAQENMVLTDEEFQEGAEAFAAQYGYDTVEEFLEEAGEEDVRMALLSDRAYRLVVDSMVIVEE